MLKFARQRRGPRRGDCRGGDSGRVRQGGRSPPRPGADAAGPGGPRPRPPRAAWRPWRRSCGCSRPQGLPGSSRVLESLCFLAAGGRDRRALIAGPNVDALREMAEMLSSLGYQTDLAPGRQAIRLAIASADYEVAFLDTTIDDPPIVLLLQQLRNDCRTAGLRIGLMARGGQAPAGRNILPAKTRSAWRFPDPTPTRPSSGSCGNWPPWRRASLSGWRSGGRRPAGRWPPWLQWRRRRERLYDCRPRQESLLAALYSPDFARAGQRGLWRTWRRRRRSGRWWTRPVARIGRSPRAGRRRPRLPPTRKRFGVLLTKRKFAGNTIATIAAERGPGGAAGATARSWTPWKPTQSQRLEGSRSYDR